MSYKLESGILNIGDKVMATAQYAKRVAKIMPEWGTDGFEVLGWEGERVILRNVVTGDETDNARCNLTHAVEA